MDLAKGSARRSEVGIVKAIKAGKPEPSATTEEARAALFDDMLGLQAGTMTVSNARAIQIRADATTAAVRARLKAIDRGDDDAA